MITVWLKYVCESHVQWARETGEGVIRGNKYV